jgi:hypothetical protein
MTQARWGKCEIRLATRGDVFLDNLLRRSRRTRLEGVLAVFGEIRDKNRSWPA